MTRNCTRGSSRCAPCRAGSARPAGEAAPGREWPGGGRGSPGRASPCDGSRHDRRPAPRAAAGGRKDSGMTALGNQARSGGEPDASTGQLVKQLSEEVSQLVRDEVRLATLEMTGKAKTAARGAGLFGGGHRDK